MHCEQTPIALYSEIVLMVFGVAASPISWQLWQFCARGTFWMEACFCNPWHLARESFELKFWEMLVEMVAKGFLGSLSRRGFPEETRINTNRFCWCFHPSCPLSWTFTFFMIPTGYTFLEPFWTLKTTSICVVRTIIFPFLKLSPSSHSVGHTYDQKGF